MTANPGKEIPEQDILDAVRELRFGVVEVHVHESRVTEIRQIRRTRFQSKSRPLDRAPQDDDSL